MDNQSVSSLFWLFLNRRPKGPVFAHVGLCFLAPPKSALGFHRWCSFLSSLRRALRLFSQPHGDVFGEGEFPAPVGEIENSHENLLPAQRRPETDRGPVSQGAMKVLSAHHRAVPVEKLGLKLSGKLLPVFMCGVALRQAF